MPIETPQTAIPTSNETNPYGEQEIFFSYDGGRRCALDKS